MEGNSGEIGYFIDKNEWGKGFATEACQAILQFGFTELNLTQVKSRCMTKNIGSKKVMEKAGMTYVQTVKNVVEKNGAMVDIDEYILY